MLCKTLSDTDTDGQMEELEDGSSIAMQYSTVQYLEPVQHHRHAGVAQLAATRAGVVVAQQEVALQRSGDIV